MTATMKLDPPHACYHPGVDQIKREATPLIRVQGLMKSFSRAERTVTAIDNFNLDVARGEFIAIVGPSGCGKSTFLHILGGFERATSGSLSIDGRPITKPGPDRGVVFQEYALYPWRTVADNITWALEIQGRSRAERKVVADMLLAKVGLTHFRDHYPAELSGGMKQRVAIARTLAFDPEVLLLDEPFGALDAQNRELMQEELQRLLNDFKRTAIFITHDIEEAIYLADRVIVFTARPGRTKADIRIDLPRPRDIEVKKTATYLEYRNQIWDLLRDEVLQARKEFG
ncbi:MULTISPECIES: ABC transporter ATP-binding protein [unclassified Beijerinckia]|uniref:ABC transporter ATP-binding protein n=1 Tax=unclassified Beijerinckia TaxID=2638183 RepID=UPI00089A0E37|nr:MULTISPECIES: ABC transporter ATP-binding protein [unclassified Beijerinckia]MDH7794056.1 NitT/TauT family transport system ATP-binding protein [Beijerinckia sp. GAS462]SEB52314.1 NitT/TauT family transport system ATP-binding protein [Beijerinckia sp. 28-YEA-48]